MVFERPSQLWRKVRQDRGGELHRQPRAKINAANQKEGLIGQDQIDLLAERQRSCGQFVGALAPKALHVSSHDDPPDAGQTEQHRNEGDDANRGPENGVLHRFWRVLQELKNEQRRDQPADAAGERKPHPVGRQARALIVIAAEFCGERSVRQPQRCRKGAEENRHHQVVSEAAPWRVRPDKFRHEPEHHEEG